MAPTPYEPFGVHSMHFNQVKGDGPTPILHHWCGYVCPSVCVCMRVLLWVCACVFVNGHATPIHTWQDA